MLLNYIRIAFRNLKKQKAYAFINIFGLGIGMACCIAIALYVQDERGYDRFLENADRVYRIALDVSINGDGMQTAYSNRPLAATLKSDIPEVEASTRLWFDPSGSMIVRSDDRKFPEDRVFFADSTFFDVFPVPFLSGDPQTALRDPFTIVLTVSTARKYFGDVDPMGKALHLREPSDRDVFTYTVTGVMEDLPQQSHIDFDFLASYVTQRASQSESWTGFGVYSYVSLRDDASPAAVQAKLASIFRRYGGPQIQEEFGATFEDFEAAGNHYRYFLQPATDIHLHSNLEDEIGPNGDARLVNLFSIVAVFILLLACVNFVNLATARSSRRAMEVGIRKTLGAQQRQIVIQFLAESILMSFAALALSVAAVQLGLPVLNALTGKALAISSADVVRYLPLLVGFGLATGLAAGAYPALYIAGFQPQIIFKKLRSVRSSRLRDALVVFQFGIATALIACTAIVYSQTQFMLDRKLGFSPEQVVVIEGAEILGPQGEAFRQSLRDLPGVLSVTNSSQVPGDHFQGSLFKMAGSPADEAMALEYTYASFDYLETLDLELVGGRSLSRAFASDSLAVMLNETAVRQLGVEDPVGKVLEWPGESAYTIVGVLKDFHIASLHREIGPVALLGPDPRNTNRPNLLTVARVSADDLPEAVAAIQATWSRFVPQEPFALAFLDETFGKLYEAERRTGNLITVFAGLAILVACFGLFGLAAFMAELRAKEVGIRKVFGATVANVVTLLSTDYVKLVGAAVFLGAPLAYFAMQEWLNTFAYRIDISVWIFVAAGLAALGIAVATVSFQAIRAAIADPIKALRWE